MISKQVTAMILENTPLTLKEDNPLIDDFFNRSGLVEKFFRWNPLSDLQQCAELRAELPVDRNRVADILHQQNSRWHASSAAMKNIEKLRDGKTLCLVTGQQVGIFGGPLYTVYKALTAIKLAESLNRQLPERRVVPCFWMEVGDNDYREINHIFILDKESRLLRLALPEQPEDFRSVALRVIPGEIEEIHHRLEEGLMPSEFKGKILGMFRKEYSEGKNFADAFARLFHHLLGDHGLVFINPADHGLKWLAKTVFRTAIEKAVEIREKIDAQNRELEKHNYPVQVRLAENQTLLFFQSDDLSRCRIDQQGEHFLVRHPKQPFTLSKNELLEILQEQPWRFSPNVLLRSLYQDFLFPTLGYVGGPGELAYTAQLAPLYQSLNMAQPIFFPRARITLVEKKIDRLVRKFGLNYPKVFTLGERLVADFTHTHSADLLESLFARPLEKLEHIIMNMEQHLREIDPTLIASLGKTGSQIERSFQNLKTRTEQALARKLDVEIRQLNRIVANLFPAGTFQERKLNMVYFLVKYGPDLVANLYHSISVEESNHQLIFL